MHQVIEHHQATQEQPIRNSELSFGNRVTRFIWSIVYIVLFRPSPRPLHRWRNFLLRLFGASLHKTARVYPRARVWLPSNLTMAANSCIADDVDVYSVDSITLGKGATVSQYSFLCTASHDFDDVRHPLITSPITIEARVWVAADVFISPGTTVHEGAVIGARSAVFHDVPAWKVAAGTPATVIRDRKLGVDDFSIETN